MRNATDASHVSSPAWRQRAAAGIVAGITAFLHR
jgi:N-acetylmuramoyl-L-alanine amidase